MKMFRTLAAMAAAALALLSPNLAFGQAIPPTFVTKMPDMSPMHFLMGTWNCSMPGKPGGTMKFTSTMDGMWMLGEGSAAQSSAQHTQMAQIYMTYDTNSSKWVWMNAQSGGGYGILYSPGWNGNTMQWKGEMSGKPGEMTMTKAGATTLRITQNAPDATGYQQTQTYTCEKAS